MNLVWLQNAAGIVRTRKKILTMAIKKQLQSMVFLSNTNNLQSFCFAIFFFKLHNAVGLLSRFIKIISTFLDYNMMSTATTRDEGIHRKNFGK